jgi:hypothetical protein
MNSLNDVFQLFWMKKKFIDWWIKVNKMKNENHWMNADVFNSFEWKKKSLSDELNEKWKMKIVEWCRRFQLFSMKIKKMKN